MLYTEIVMSSNLNFIILVLISAAPLLLWAMGLFGSVLPGEHARLMARLSNGAAASSFLCAVIATLLYAVGGKPLTVTPILLCVARRHRGVGPEHLYQYSNGDDALSGFFRRIRGLPLRAQLSPGRQTSGAVLYLAQSHARIYPDSDCFRQHADVRIGMDVHQPLLASPPDVLSRAGGCCTRGA